jgi:hypothetical protein
LDLKHLFSHLQTFDSEKQKVDKKRHAIMPPCDRDDALYPIQSHDDDDGHDCFDSNAIGSKDIHNTTVDASSDFFSPRRKDRRNRPGFLPIVSTPTVAPDVDGTKQEDATSEAEGKAVLVPPRRVVKVPTHEKRETASQPSRTP